MLETIPIALTTKAQRKKFDCGNVNLNDYFRRYADSNDTIGFGKTFVLVREEEVMGYYTVCMSCTFNFKNIIVDCPNYAIPAGLIGRLAVHKQNQKQGLGKWLLADALSKISKAAEEVGAYAAVVNAKDESAKAFYVQFGFLPFPTDPLTLYMALATFKELVKKPISQIVIQSPVSPPTF